MFWEKTTDERKRSSEKIAREKEATKSITSRQKTSYERDGKTEKVAKETETIIS